ncbi:hypothetical protein KAM336_44910 [Aeromonas caviae]|uniref:Uncharacterized protein n=1 Tax=Aeromonas caviae TaxID=648 RepID=A0AA37FXL4_AERCA|nr:hypothetical protein KAM336_44910 [Aeromonas caviae]GJA30322.1 hypothetical protein KAM340_44890 [Aeromonas caviae]GJA66022.1 hypothetical protein KAM351_46330 [Aeromonas caviae]
MNCYNVSFVKWLNVVWHAALFPKSTIKPQLPQPQVTVTLGAF